MTPALMTTALRAIRRWHQRKATAHILEGLDDRMLKDIGIHRSQIRTIVEAEAGAGRSPRRRAPESALGRGAPTAA
jgi:uncharacterized protein YjiS (DUF1127 family)